jgi:cytochrome c oxidase subunit 1
MHFLGLAGMPRRIPDYALQFTEFNQISTVGAFIFGFAQLIFLYIIIESCFRSGQSHLDNKVWDGAQGLEWDLPTPVPYHTFETAPTVD